MQNFNDILYFYYLIFFIFFCKNCKTICFTCSYKKIKIHNLRENWPSRRVQVSRFAPVFRLCVKLRGATRLIWNDWTRRVCLGCFHEVNARVPPPPPPPPFKIQRLFENITCEADRFPIELSEKRMAGEKRSSRGKIRRWREDWSLWCWRQRVVLLVPASSSRYYIARTYRYPSDCFVLNVFSLFCAPKCISPH